MFLRTFSLALLLLPVSGIAQERVHLPPRLDSADMPYYPPIAMAAHITGWLRIKVDVEGGKVVRTELIDTETRSRLTISKTGTQFLTTPTVNYIKSWHFDSNVNDSFVVKFTYQIAGTATDRLTTPKIEILPTLDVNITARPVKPTVNY
jgi:hypothetical protein